MKIMKWFEAFVAFLHLVSLFYVDVQFTAAALALVVAVAAASE